MPCWTKKQIEAIEDRDKNLLVAAGAGSGKTAVLVERIIKRIMEDNIDIDRMLIVTFTNAAASEMKERIGNAIIKELNNNYSRNLKRQLILLNKANITTIHSFCLDVIKNNFHKAGIDPYFRIADKTESMMLKIDSVDTAFENMYKNQKDGSFSKLVEMYGRGKNDNALRELILNVYDNIMSYPAPFKWFLDKVNLFDVQENFEFKSSVWGKCIINQLKVTLRELKEKAQAALDMAAEQGIGNYINVISYDLDIVKNIEFLIENKKWDEIAEGFSSLNFKALRNSKKDGYDEDIALRIKEERNDIKDVLKSFKDDVMVFKNEAVADDLKILYPAMMTLFNTITEFDGIYKEQKEKRNILDFSDLEHKALKILSLNEVCLEYRNKFNEIYIDEYQDSNLIQEEILTSVSRAGMDNPNMFMVGDVKQSIYRFRNARPELFLEKYMSYPEENIQKSKKIILNRNFRSRQNILDTVNHIFYKIMSKSSGEIEYNKNELLKKGFEYPKINEEGRTGGKTELHIIDADQCDAAGETGRTDNKINSEIGVIIERINELMGKGDSEKPFLVYDKKLDCMRPVKYKDIVILLRATSKWADIFTNELAYAKIPCFADTDSGYFDTYEVRLILSVLKIIDNPRQDIPLTGVLRSDIFKFDETSLALIRIKSKREYLYDAVKIYSKNTGQLAEKCAGFINMLEELRNKAIYMPVNSLIWEIISKTGFYNYVLAMPGGEQRQANLRLLIKRADQYEKTSFKGLFNFNSFIENIKMKNQDFGSAKILGESENVVRIMSIHKSKGLEFPVVFLAGTGRQFNKTDSKKPVLMHYDLGFGPKIVDINRKITYQTAPGKAVFDQVNSESIAEEMRILYVALTRAREKLIITGAIKDVEKKVGQWTYINKKYRSKKIPSLYIKKASGIIDWIGAALISDENNFDITVHKPKVINNDFNIMNKEIHSILSELENRDIDRAVKDEVKNRLNYKYGHKGASKLPVKISVTQVKKFEMEQEDDYVKKIGFDKPFSKIRPFEIDGMNGPDAVSTGNAVHFLMQNIELEKIKAAKGAFNAICSIIKDNMIELNRKGMFDKAYINKINIQKIASFFTSDLGKRMLLSKQIKREVPFTVFIDAKKINIYRELEGIQNEKLLLQGIIDCFFKEDESLVIIDYKTDHAVKGKENIFKKKYGQQLKYYKYALGKITGREVKEMYLYLFSINTYIRID